MDITIVSPDDEFGCPAYEGPIEMAHTKLKPGLYTGTEDATGDEVALAILHNESPAIRVAIVDIDHVHTR